MYEAHTLFPHGQVLELSWSPKAELVLLLVFLLSLPSPRGFPLTCVPMCLWGLSLPCMFVAFLAPCWYESQEVFTFFFLTRHAFGNLIYRICISRLVHGSFFTLSFLYSSGSCTRSAAPCLLGKLPFPRCHFSVMVARELSDSFHPQHFKNIFTWKLGNCDHV